MTATVGFGGLGADGLWARGPVEATALRLESPALDDAVADLGATDAALFCLDFRHDGAHRLLRAARWRAAPPPHAGVAPPPWRPRERPSATAYAATVRSAVDAIAAGDLAKVVLGRWLDLVPPAPLSAQQRDALVATLVARLRATSPHAGVYALPAGGSDTLGRQRMLVGASPELLVARSGAEVRSTPLAGSAARAGDPVEDLRVRDALLRSAKDSHEHRFVVETVARTLRPFCRDLEVPRTPVAIATDSMWHLATPIRGRLTNPRDPRVAVLQLAADLHPTPAVCGEPRERAAALIRGAESRERGPLTGVVGRVDARGDGTAAVVIRSALVGTDDVRIFAGAGIVAGSDPDAEARETAAKWRTMLRALDADGAIEAMPATGPTPDAAGAVAGAGAAS